MSSVPKVTLYAVSTCHHCKAVKELLTSANVELAVIEVDHLDETERKEALQKVRQVNHQVSFPTAIIGDKVVVGNKAHQIKDALESLTKEE